MIFIFFKFDLSNFIYIFYLFKPLFFLKNEGMSKSFCELALSCDAGIVFIFLSHALLTISPTCIEPATLVSFSKPVAITVITKSSSNVSSITAPKIMLASGSTLL